MRVFDPADCYPMHLLTCSGIEVTRKCYTWSEDDLPPVDEDYQKITVESVKVTTQFDERQPINTN